MSRAWHCLAVLLVVLTFALFVDASLYRPSATFTITENIQIAEAQAWWKGRLDLPERKWDSALIEGKVYSHFPPAFSFISVIVVPFFDGVPHWVIEIIVVLPVLILAYWLSTLLAPTPMWAALMAVGLVCGTSALPVLEKALRGGSPYSVNQAIALSGLLMFLIAYVGNKGFWLAGLGVVVAAWSRQMSVVYLLPLASMAFEKTHATASSASTEPIAESVAASSQGKGLFARWGIVAIFAFGVPLTLNWLKFHSPLDSGYMRVYEGRTEDQFARDARNHGLFSTRYIPRNFYYSNLGLPELHGIKRGEQAEWYLTANDWGTGIWWTTPMLFFAIAGTRSILSDPKRRMLLLSAGLAYIGLLLYHSTGFEQRGYNRYSLDYLPVLVVLAAPAAMASSSRRWLTAGLISWSVFYFAVARHWPQMRIW